MTILAEKGRTQPARLSGLSARLQSRGYGRSVATALLTLLLGFLTLYPLSMLLYGSLHSTPPGMAGVFNLAGYRAILTAANLQVLAYTISLSLVKTIPALLLAILFAWIVARTDSRAVRRSRY